MKGIEFDLDEQFHIKIIISTILEDRCWLRKALLTIAIWWGLSLESIARRKNNWFQP